MFTYVVSIVIKLLPISLQSRDFDNKHHGALQDMWYKAHYKEAESVRGRSLGECRSRTVHTILGLVK